MICIFHVWEKHIQWGNLRNFAEIFIGTFKHEWKKCKNCGKEKHILKEFNYEK